MECPAFYTFNSPLLLWKNLNKAMFSMGLNVEMFTARLSTTWRDFGVELQDIGYKKDGNKLRRLIRTYLNSSEIDKFNKKRREVISKKKDFVLLFRFGNQEKKNTVAGDFCLIAATFIFSNGKLRNIDIYYRTTEVTTKFLADLIFLRDLFSNVLFIEVNGVTVNFFFSKAYVKYLHFLNYVRISKKFFKEDPSEALEKGREFVEKVKDGRFQGKYKSTQRAIKKFLEDEKCLKDQQELSV